jgi:ribosomal-protein-alanine N-acetyltransferase
MSPPGAAAPALLMRPLYVADLDAVLRIEAQAYEFPWTRGNFIDSLAAGYWAHALYGVGDGDRGSAPELLAYAWALPGVEELHLLNLTVAPGARGRGHARCLLDHLVAWGRTQRATQLWLEVRPSNLRAIALYERYGFRSVGRRPGYYPAAQGQREDATVMGLALAEPAPAPSTESAPSPP